MEALACPRCEQSFRLSPDAVGKTIQCHSCGQMFQMPNATPPLAIPCEINGIDARRCPECGRTFSMQPALVDKTIRCRGCKSSFRVTATSRPTRQATEWGGGSRHKDPPWQSEPMPQAARQLPPHRSVPQSQSVPHSKSELKRLLAVVAAGLCVVIVLDAILGRGSNAVPVVVQAEPEVPPPDVRPVERPVVQQPQDVVPQVLEPPPPPAEPPPAPPAVVALPVEPVAPPVPQPVDVTPPPARPVMQTFDTPEIDHLLREAYSALQREDFATADRALAEGESRAAGHRDANKRVTSWKLLASYARKYVPLREAAFQAANQGREYELDGEPFSVVEIRPDMVVYLLDGKHERVPRAALDPRIEMAIVEKWLDRDGRPANHIYLGVRWLCCDPPRLEPCRAEWQMAANRGAPVAALLPLLDDSVITSAPK
jgi:DNA-directed RNA polymerase subunit RPC12/RpoP